MRHLPPEVLLDIAENARLESSAPHLATCASCREQIDAARRVLMLVGTMEAPEPSPLFWDHLSTRVRDAVAAEAAPQTAQPWGWRSWRLTAVVSAAVVVLSVVLIFKGGPASVPVPVPAEGDAVASAGAEIASLQDDPSLSLIADLAGELDWDGAAEAGFMVGSGTAEGAIPGLSIEERAELRRLLTEELGGRQVL